MPNAQSESESFLYVLRNFALLAIQNVPSEVSTHTAWMRMLILNFAVWTSPNVRHLTLRFKLLYLNSLRVYRALICAINAYNVLKVAQ